MSENKFQYGDKVTYTNKNGFESHWIIKDFESIDQVIVVKDMGDKEGNQIWSVPTCKLKPYKEKEVISKRVEAHKRDVRIASGAVAMAESLNQACDNAGGSGFTWKELQELSVADLCCMLGTNNVRFVYDRNA